MSKKIISIILSIAMILSSISFPAFAAEEATVSFGDAVISGEEIKVPVILSALPAELNNIAAFTFVYTYGADNLRYVGTEAALLPVDEDSAVPGKVSWYSSEGVDTVADDVLFYLVFDRIFGSSDRTEIGTTVIEAASSSMKGVTLANTSALIEFEPVIPAVLSLDAVVNDDGTVEVPVTLDKVPDNLADIAAFTFTYTYDTNVLSYKETKAGVMSVDEATAVAGKVSWFDKDAPVADVSAELFTLVFDIADATAESTVVAPGVIEIADSSFNRTTDVESGDVVAQLIAKPEYTEAVIALGNAEIVDGVVKIPVTLDKIPDDIEDMASLTLRYSFDKDVLTYKGTEAGVIDVTDYTTEGNISWYTGEAVTKDLIGDSVLFTLIFEIKENQTGTTNVAISTVEMGDSLMKASEYLTKKDTSIELPEVEPAEKAVITYGPADINDENGEIRIPVSIDRIPVELVDISAATIEYEYDASKITYVGVESGILEVDDSYAAQGIVSWFSMEPVTTAGTLFTLVFSTNKDAEGETSIIPGEAELGDSKFHYTNLEGEGCTFVLPDLSVLNNISLDISEVEIAPLIWDDIDAIYEYITNSVSFVVTANYTKPDGTEYSEVVTDYIVVIDAQADGKKAVVKFEDKTAEIVLKEAAKILDAIIVDPASLEVAPKIWNDDAKVKAFVEENINTVTAKYTNAADGVVVNYIVTIEADGEGKKAVVSYEENDKTASFDIALSQEAKKLDAIVVDPASLEVAPKIWNDDAQVKALVEANINTVTAKYTNADDEAVTGYTVAIETTAEGKKAVVTYAEKTFDITLTKEAKKLDAIVVDPASLEVAPKIWNDDAQVKAFVEANIKTVTAKYTNAYDEAVTGYTVAIETTAEGKKAVVTYAEKTFDITLTQEAKKLDTIVVDPASLEVAPKIWNDDAQVKAFVEENINTVTAIYTNADDEVVTDYTVAIETTTEGKKAVVTYAEKSFDIALSQEAKKLDTIVVDPASLEVAPKIWNDDAQVKAFVEANIKTVTAKYTNADDEAVTGYTVAIETTTEGKKAVVTYAEKTFDITLTQEAKKLDSIVVDPASLEVAPKIWNDDAQVKAFVEANIKTVTAKYTNADDEAVTGYTVAIETTTEGKKAVVTYAEKTFDIALTQEAKKLDTIVVDPASLEVAPKIWNDDAQVKVFVEANIKTVTAKYTNADDEVVANYTVTIEADGEGKKAVVSYEENDKTASFDIALSQEAKKLDTIVVDPASLEVAPKIWNDDAQVKAFVEANIKTVTAKYTNADDEVVAGYAIVIEADGEGKKAVVSYEENDKTASFDVVLTQEAKKLDTIVVDPASLEVAPKIWNDDAQVKAFVEANIKTVTAKYTNADDEVVAGYAIVIEADGEGKKAVVTYGEKSFDVALSQEAKKLDAIVVDPASLEVAPKIWNDDAQVKAFVEANIKTVTAKYTNADDEVVAGYAIVIEADGEGKKAVVTYGEKSFDVALSQEAKKTEAVETNITSLEISPVIWEDAAEVEAYLRDNMEVTIKYSNADDEVVDSYTVTFEESGEDKLATITYDGKSTTVTLIRGLFTVEEVIPVYNLDGHRAYVITMYADGVPYVDGEISVKIEEDKFVFVTDNTDPVITVAKDETAEIVEWGKLHRGDKVTALDALIAINAANGVIADAFKVHDNVYVSADVVFDYVINAIDALAINNISLGKVTSFRVVE